MANQIEDEIDKQPSIMPFDWTKAGHVIVKAGEAVDWKIDDVAKFARRVQLIEYGLSAEVECAAILSWLGRCAVVHRLDQDAFSSTSDRKWSIPDLLAIFEHRGVRVPVLIEVKSTKNERLVFPTRQLEAMHEYAKALSLPLLIAWKPRRLGFWLLVDPVHAESDGSKSAFSFEVSAKNNLLSCVAGDFVIVPQPNCGLFMEAEVVKKTRETSDGFEGIAKITKSEFRDTTGNTAKGIPPAIMALMFTVMDVVDDRVENLLRRSFVTKQESVHAQQVLRTAIAFKATDEPIKWRHVGKELDSILSREELSQAIKSHIGTFVKYQLFMHPQTWPEFLPKIWNDFTYS